MLVVVKKSFLDLCGLSEHVFAFEEVREYQIGMVERFFIWFGLLFVVEELHGEYKIGVKQFFVHDLLTVNDL